MNEHARLADLRRRLRQTGGRGRKLRGLLELLRPYRARTLLMIGSLLLATAAALAPPPLAKLAIDNGIVPGDTAALTWIVLLFLLTAVIYWAATYAQTYLTGWVGQRALQDLRIQLFAHLQTLSVGFYSRRQAGVLISRLTNDVQALDQLVSDGVVTLFGSTLTLVGTAAILIVLDDATSSVDASTEQAIKVALQEVMAGRTTFVIAHRLSTIALADDVVVLEDGRIAARGSHTELLDRSPLYAEIAAKGLPDQVFLTRKPLESEVAGL